MKMPGQKHLERPSASEQAVRFEALDGASLGGTLFVPSEEPHSLLLVNSGAGIPQGFYRRFAGRAAARGFATLTYDYRGIGESAPPSLRGFEARCRDWGQRDVPGAIRWLRQRDPSLPLRVIGHSTGGQQLGLAPNLDEVTRAVFVGVSTGYWRAMQSPFKWFTLGLWRVYLPIATRLYGYAPSKKIRQGENLPAGVAREWGTWCLEPEYLAAYFDEGGRLAPSDGEPFGPVHFEEARFPIRAYCFPDDPIATAASVPAMLNLYENSPLETRWVAPEDLGVQEIGHFGFFRSHIGGPLWEEALDWLEDRGHGDLGGPPTGDARSLAPEAQRLN